MIANELYSFLQGLYSYYNGKIFHSDLPECQINLCRKKNSPGFFIAERWVDGEKQLIHEINLNPQDLGKKASEWHAILVYYMVHLWQFVNKLYAKEAGHHNRGFMQKMAELGFNAEYIINANGKKNYRKIIFSIIPGGLFDTIYNELEIKEIEIIPLPEPDSSENKKEKIIKYQCLSCTSSIWGKRDLIDICWDCFELRIRQDISKEEYSEQYYKKVRIAKIILAFLKKIKSRLFLKAEAKYKEKEGEKK